MEAGGHQWILEHTAAAGLYDCNTGLEMARDVYRNLESAKFELFSESAHYLHPEEPEKFAAIIRAFLEDDHYHSKKEPFHR